MSSLPHELLHSATHTRAACFLHVRALTRILEVARPYFYHILIIKVSQWVQSSPHGRDYTRAWIRGGGD